MFVVGVQFRSAMYMVGEGDGSVTVTVVASKDHADFDFVIKMVAQDGTAESMWIRMTWFCLCFAD